MCLYPVELTAIILGNRKQASKIKWWLFSKTRWRGLRVQGHTYIHEVRFTVFLGNQSSEGNCVIHPCVGGEPGRHLNTHRLTLSALCSLSSPLSLSLRRPCKHSLHNSPGGNEALFVIAVYVCVFYIFFYQARDQLEARCCCLTWCRTQLPLPPSAVSVFMMWAFCVCFFFVSRNQESWLGLGCCIITEHTLHNPSDPWWWWCLLEWWGFACVRREGVCGWMVLAGSECSCVVFI